MSDPAVHTSPRTDRDSRVRVRIQADAGLYEGTVYLSAESLRLQDVLNDPRPFLNLTDVEFYDAATGGTTTTPYVALNKGAVTHVILLGEDGPARQALSGSGGADAGSSSLLSGQGPTVPPAGPPTLPAPPPAARGAGGDSVTQPYRSVGEGFGDEDDVSDLILEDDGELALDDLDPDDLERDPGSVVGGHGDR